jgi:uncharacterized protein YjdB
MKKSLFPSALAGSVLLALILSSCPPPTGSAVLVNSITLSPKTLTLDVGQTRAISPTVLPDNADNPALSWSSDTPEAATVDQNGTVTAVAPGTANITATAADGSGISAASRVTVRAPVLVESISLKPVSLALVLGQTAIGTFTPTILPETASNKALLWSSSDTAVATVDETGIVTAVAVGTATITATATDGSGKSAAATVTVAESPIPVIPVTSVAVSPPALALELGGTATGTLSATVLPDTATNTTVLWTSDRPTVATVDPDTGVVTAVSVGTAAITAQAKDGSGKRGTAAVTVSEIVIPVESVTLSPKTLDLVLGGASATGSLTAAVAPDSASNKAVIWSSSNSAVASVSQSGVVTAVSAGAATITATAAGDSEKSDTATVTVGLPEGVTATVDSIAIAGSPTTIVHHATVTLSKTVLPAGAYQEVTWASSNSGVASVSQAGVVTGTGVGTADITAKAKDGTNKVSNTWTVTVTPLAVSSVAVSPLSLMVGTTGTPTFSVLPDNASNKGLSWVSDNTAVAAVHPSTGVVTAVSLGTANITATAVDGSGESDSAVVTVTPDPSLTNADLQSLSPNSGSLDPAFDADTTEYTLSVNTGSVTFTAEPADTNAAVAFLPSNPISLAGGETKTLTVEVTAGDTVTVKTYTVVITRTVPVASITLSKTAMELLPAMTEQLSLQAVMPANAADKSVTWESSAPSVAAVDQTGLVSALSTGTANITARANDGSGVVSAPCVVTVVNGAGLVIEFAGFGDEDIHFTQESSLVLYKGSYSVGVIVTGAWDSCTWFLDGELDQSYFGSSSFAFRIDTYSYPANTEHTLTAVVAKGNEYYSKTLTFKVLP